MALRWGLAVLGPGGVLSPTVRRQGRVLACSRVRNSVSSSRRSSCRARCGAWRHSGRVRVLRRSHLGLGVALAGMLRLLLLLLLLLEVVLLLLVILCLVLLLLLLRVRGLLRGEAKLGVRRRGLRGGPWRGGVRERLLRVRVRVSLTLSVGVRRSRAMQGRG